MAGAFQSTRPLRGETIEGVTQVFAYNFSIHSPLAGRDFCMILPLYTNMYFSIHSPLAGRDNKFALGRGNIHFFNPLAPCGARPYIRLIIANWIQSFQSTRPLRGETGLFHQDFEAQYFSIHSPLAGRDENGIADRHAGGFFNPLAPCGARLVDQPQYFYKKSFSIHSPLAGRDFSLTCDGGE